MSAFQRQMAEGAFGCWPMQELTGTVMTDVSGNSRHGVYANGPTLNASGYLSGKSSVDFSTGTDYASVALDLTPFNAVTVAFMFNRAAYTNGDQLAMEFSPTVNTNKGWYIDPDASGFASNQMAVTMTNTGGTNYWQEWYNRPAAGWHLWHCLFDYAAAGADQVRLWIDTVEQAPIGNGPANADIAGPHANTTLYVASRGGTSLQAAQKMSHLAIYGSDIGVDRRSAQYRAAWREGVMVG